MTESLTVRAGQPVTTAILILSCQKPNCVPGQSVTRNRGSFDGSRSSELHRSHNARSQGYQRYNNRSAGAAQVATAGHNYVAEWLVRNGVIPESDAAADTTPVV